MKFLRKIIILFNGEENFIKIVINFLESCNEKSQIFRNDNDILLKLMNIWRNFDEIVKMLRKWT